MAREKAPNGLWTDISGKNEYKLNLSTLNDNRDGGIAYGTKIRAKIGVKFISLYKPIWRYGDYDIDYSWNDQDLSDEGDFKHFVFPDLPLYSNGLQLPVIHHLQ